MRIGARDRVGRGALWAWTLVALAALAWPGCSGSGGDGDADADADADTDADGDADGDADADRDAGADAEADAGGDAGAEAGADADPGDEPDAEPDADAGPLPDLGAAGPYEVTEADDFYNPDGICVTPTTVFTPAGAPAGPVVVLTHGFSRAQAVVAGLARHLASWGLTVATMTLCHSSPLDNDWEADAEALRGLADRAGATSVIYVGHSAGGLRSVLAARDDPRALAVLGLDLVDVSDAALDAAPLLGVPLYGIFGEPYSCNSSGNGVAVVAAAAEHAALRVTEADHCDFEWPTDPMCTALCNQPNPSFEVDAVRTLVRTLATAFVLWQSGLDPAGERWWSAGSSPHDDLVAAGAMTRL